MLNVLKNKIMEKYARKCDITGRGMNEGYCWGDGMFYTATSEDTIKELRSDIVKSEGDEYWSTSKDRLLVMTDEELLDWGYEQDMYYYTEWYDEEYCEGDTYYDKEGNEYEVEEEIYLGNIEQGITNLKVYATNYGFRLKFYVNSYEMSIADCLDSDHVYRELIARDYKKSFCKVILEML